MTIPNGPIVGGKFSVVGAVLFVGAVIGLYLLCKWIFKEEVVVTDAAGNTTKIGEVKTSFAFGKKADEKNTATQTAASATGAATNK